MTTKAKEAKGEIVINENDCQGCGYCVKFCPTGAITTSESEDKITLLGYQKAIFAHPEKCTACAVCYWMCSHQAIEVYKFVMAKE